MKKKTVKFLIKLLVSAGFVFWVVFKVNWREVLFYLSEIKLWQIFLYVAVYFLGVLISAYKWKLLCDFKEIRHKFTDYFRFYLAGAFINNFMPSFIGGDTFRAFQIGEKDGKYTESASAVLMDRITGFVGAAILALIFGLANFKNIIGNKMLVLFNALVIVSLFSDFLLIWFSKTALFQRLKKYIPEKVLEVLRGVRIYNKNSKILYRAVLCSMLFNFVGVAVANYILFLSLGINISVLNYLSAVFLISIVSALPVSINNIGIKEWAYITFFGAFGAQSEAVITVAILSRFLQALINFTALPVYLKSRRGKA